MTTPQSILQDIYYNMRELINAINGIGEDRQPMNEVLDSLQKGVQSCCDEIVILENRLDLIIRLLNAMSEGNPRREKRNGSNKQDIGP